MRYSTTLSGFLLLRNCQTRDFKAQRAKNQDGLHREGTAFGAVRRNGMPLRTKNEDPSEYTKRKSVFSIIC